MNKFFITLLILGSFVIMHQQILINEIAQRSPATVARRSVAAATPSNEWLCACACRSVTCPTACI